MRDTNGAHDGRAERLQRVALASAAVAALAGLVLVATGNRSQVAYAGLLVAAAAAVVVALDRRQRGRAGT